MYFDQPFSRLAQLIRVAMPDRRRVGVLLGPDSQRYQNELRQALRRAGLEDVIERVSGRDDLPLELGERRPAVVATPSAGEPSRPRLSEAQARVAGGATDRRCARMARRRAF